MYNIIVLYFAFLTRSLMLGILFSTVLEAAVVAKPVVPGISTRTVFNLYPIHQYPFLGQLNQSLPNSDVSTLVAFLKSDFVA